MKLRPLQIKDTMPILEWMHDESVNKFFMADFKDFTEEQVHEFIKSSITSEHINYACVDKDDLYLGTISLKHIELSSLNAEFAISFSKKAQGTGAAQFATLEILKEAFETLKLERVYLNVFSINYRAIEFYKKIGFIYEGEFRKHVRKNGELIDLQWYGMLKEEYTAIKNTIK